MDSIETSLEHDFLLAAISVIPAAILWIALDRFYLGAALGIALFLAVEYGYPAFREGRINVVTVKEISLSFVTHLRSLIPSRVARRA